MPMPPQTLLVCSFLPIAHQNQCAPESCVLSPCLFFTEFPVQTSSSSMITCTINPANRTPQYRLPSMPLHAQIPVSIHHTPQACKIIFLDSSSPPLGRLHLAPKQGPCPSRAAYHPWLAGSLSGSKAIGLLHTLFLPVRSPSMPLAFAPSNPCDFVLPSLLERSLSLTPLTLLGASRACVPQLSHASLHSASLFLHWNALSLLHCPLLIHLRFNSP
ncbi:hypothetical protein DFH06DRAFT_50887 [Mycena polygramma]|nr:hypothetical protein DFH06DRAFT_50887 [Mycena polygramma]